MTSSTRCLLFTGQLLCYLVVICLSYEVEGANLFPRVNVPLNLGQSEHFYGLDRHETLLVE